jgi:hypothetical protein
MNHPDGIIKSPAIFMLAPPPVYQNCDEADRKPGTMVKNVLNLPSTTK